MLKGAFRSRTHTPLRLSDSIGREPWLRAPEHIQGTRMGPLVVSGHHRVVVHDAAISCGCLGIPVHDTIVVGAAKGAPFFGSTTTVLTWRMSPAASACL